MANNQDRRPLIAGNWKMNTTIDQGLALAKDIVKTITPTKADVVLCPPFTHITEVGKIVADTDIEVGAQNMFYEESGAYTGEISAEMLISIGCNYVIIGHSERREIFKETNEDVNKKLHAALKAGLKPIVAVGETLEEREQNKTEDKIKDQATKALVGIESLENIVFAYEPIWAIGTGKTATPEQANDVNRYIRAILGSLYSPDQAKYTRIIYGGSVNPENADILMNEPDIDGALVGGACLKCEHFAQIINSASSG
ncbi:hypothetical protein LCGC14_1204340 [marine sediment metagenome]|uniref:triose-phosphate isomerase n=1 Tax=marine sediment metagenome TaxID=412755 RepID=A0A0F9LG01_9ZZZZ